MAKSKANDEGAERMDNPQRKRNSGKTWIYVEETVKSNGTYYSGTAVEVDDAVAKQLMSAGSAREAEQEEIDNAIATLDAQRQSITSKVETMRALGVEPAVDEEGNEIPNSFTTRETKLRNEEGNTLAGASTNEDDEDGDGDDAAPDLRKAASANPPDATTDSSARKQSSGSRRI